MSDSLDLFFESIANTEILDKESEIKLSKIIQGCPCSGSNPSNRCQNCRPAIDTFVIHNLPLVVRVAKKFRGRDFSFQDLIGTGIYGLFIAAIKYNHTKNVRFAYYAPYWIRDEIMKALRTCSGLPKLPLYPAAKIRKISKVVSELMQEGKEVTIAAIAEKTDFSETTVQQLRPFLHQLVSIDDFNLVSNIPTPDVEYERTERIRLIREELKKVLTEVQLYVVCCTIMDGVFGESKLSLKEVAERRKLSLDKVKQIRDESLTILKTDKLLKLIYEEM